jgi:parvulin-like peptidyl-prolyl isomerase
MKRHILRSSLLAGLFCLLSAGRAPGGVVYQDGLVAVVNDVAITAYDLRAELDPLERDMKKQFQGQELVDKITDLRRNFLRQRVEQELIYAEFQARKLTVPTSLVQSRLDRIIVSQTGGDRNRFQTLLAQQKMTLEELEKKLEKNVAVELMLDEYTKRPVNVTPAEVKAYYDTHPETFTTQAKYRLQAIVVHQTDKTPEELATKIAAIETKLKSGSNFADLAREVSEDISSSKGGDLGWYDAQNPPRQEFASLVKDLPQGQVAPKLTLGKTVYFLGVSERVTAGTISLAQVQDRIELLLRRQREQKLHREFINTLRQKFFVQIYQ